MKELIQKYWYILILLFTLPIILNFTLRLNSPVGILGTPETWLAFWSTYSATIIGSLITLFVLFKTLKQNEANNNESKKLQIAIYQKGLEERRIQELAKTFKESLHYIEFPTIYSNRDLIKEQKYDQAEQFFSSELNKCIHTLSSYSIDYITTDDNKKIEKYLSTFQKVLNLYLPTIHTAARIISILQQNTLNDKQLRFEYLYMQDKNRQYFTENERYFFINAENDTQFKNFSLKTLNHRLDILSRNHLKLQEILINLSNEIIEDKLKELNNFETSTNT